MSVARFWQALFLGNPGGDRVRRRGPTQLVARPTEEPAERTTARCGGSGEVTGHERAGVGNQNIPK